MSAEKEYDGNLRPYHPNFCIQCGAPVADVRASFCMVCGKPLAPIFPDLSTSVRNRPFIVRRRRPTEVPADLETVTWPAYISLLMPVISFLLLTMVTVVVAIVFFLVTPYVTLAFLFSTEFLIVGLFIEICFILLPFIYLRKYFPPHSAKYKFQVMGLPIGREKTQKLWLEILIGLGVGFGLVFLVTGIQVLSELLWEAVLGPSFVEYGVNAFGETDMGLVPMNSVQLVLIWVAMFVAVGFGEELLYRGFTQRGLVKKWGKGAGILVTAMLFTLAHIVPGLVPIQTFIVFFLPYFAISLLLGYMREWRKGNLLACIIAHGFYNSLILTFAFLGI